MEPTKYTPVTASEYAYAQMKEWILNGTCKSGEKINQDEYAKKLGLSRLPIRTAIEKLAFTLPDSKYLISASLPTLPTKTAVFIFNTSF